ncbi:MAG: hypothetical protein D4S01_07420 [Dehalococcoidia bacterium]|nr:MAG: hypothetical protein D4S01_07420 [Dehalococcoidia bacterium]
MKFCLSFKTPDVTDQINYVDCDDDERDAVKALVEKFVEYAEYATIEFDTKDGTARVVPV